jgi:hypothetical protein
MTEIKNTVMQCYHEGCQWRDQWATIQRQQEKIKLLEAKLEELKATLRAITV